MITGSIYARQEEWVVSFMQTTTGLLLIFNEENCVNIVNKSIAVNIPGIGGLRRLHWKNKQRAVQVIIACIIGLYY